ncbi:MAG: hypothetical protein WD080_09835 [Egibacteraceae bacterium]
MTPPRQVGTTEEGTRLSAPFSGPVAPWRFWGPYVGDRAWATVREDYSPDGSAWTSLTHDLARSKAYRWGEDAIAGICDRYQKLVLGVVLWNGRDPILKERFFGLTPQEGNHGEDAKEHWHYLDATPTHSYLRMLYRYPQARFPYEQLVDENRRRAGRGPELTLADTGVFDDGRYFDVEVEYAKASPHDLCVRIEVRNAGPEDAELHLLPQLWFRNIWSWGPAAGCPPRIARVDDHDGLSVVAADDGDSTRLDGLRFDFRVGRRLLFGPQAHRVLFTDNETNAERVYGPPATSRSPYTTDAFHRHVVAGADCVNPDGEGTKAALWYRVTVPTQGSFVLRLRFTDAPVAAGLDDVDRVVAARRGDADELYAAVHPVRATADERAVQRQALAGMLWSKQVYIFDVATWLDGDDPSNPPPASRRGVRNAHWRHLNSMRVLTMPDAWEYPWFAAWDLAFQCVTLALVDPEFAKENLWALLFEQFQHPNGQIPAYEWEFSDLNPPVHAWACWEVYQAGKRQGEADRAFLERCFHKLLINFAWWVNRVDREGNNVFEGGFLGLDNISVVDRSEPMPDGAVLQQSDATGWMGAFCLSLMRIALELSEENDAYEVLATKFFQHFVYIVGASKRMGGRDYQLWDEEDGFFYDVLRYPGGEFHKFRLRSLVGLIPLYAVEVLDGDDLVSRPHFRENLEWFLEHRRDLVGDSCFDTVGDGSRYVLSMVSPPQLARVLQRLWDDEEFLSPYGLRSLSKYHEHAPYRLGGAVVGYEPAEAVAKLKGGNSNWRGPVWFPTSYLLIRSLRRFSEAFGDAFAVVTPASSGQPITPAEMAEETANRMIRLFTIEDGRRAFWGHRPQLWSQPSWRDTLLFHEYFHGDTGAGLGAAHQTGWTGLVANLIDEWRR